MSSWHLARSISNFFWSDLRSFSRQTAVPVKMFVLLCFSSSSKSFTRGGKLMVPPLRWMENMKSEKVTWWKDNPRVCCGAPKL